MHRVAYNIKGIKLIIHGYSPTVKLDKFCKKLRELGFLDNTPSQIYKMFEGGFVKYKLNWVRQQYLLRYLFYTMKMDCTLCVFQHSDEIRIWKRVAECMLINGAEIHPINLRTSDSLPIQEDVESIKELLNLLR
jgi:hypothetical protein